MIIFQDEDGCIKYGYISMSCDESDDGGTRDILFVNTISRARRNTPLNVGGTPDSIIYVTEEGFLADRKVDYITGAWDYGPLTELQLQVAPHSNLASSTSPGHYVCFEDPNGNLCLVSAENGVECMDHGKDLNILPGTALAIKSWKSYAGPIGWGSSHEHLTIGFQDRNGRPMSLERKTGGGGPAAWNLSEIVAPSITEGFPFKPWTRNNCLFSLRPSSPPQIEHALFPDSSGRLLYHACDKSGRLLGHSNPVCTIWENSQYAYRDRALIYMSSNGHLECTLLHEDPEVHKTRAIFQPRCRRRCHPQLRWTLEGERNRLWV